jgi:hypothetical protein
MERSLEIQPDEWPRFFDEFSKAHEGWIVDVDVVGPEIGDQEAASGLPLVGLGADVKDGERRVEVMVGGRREAHVTRIIEKPQRVWLEVSDVPGHDGVAIESDDGTMTIVTFRHVDPDVIERQLPPG